MIYSTYVAGSWGATPVGIALDAQGDVIVAGQTGSPDYPTTPGSLVEQWPESWGVTIGYGIWTTGYLTMLNQDGSNLVFSTYLSGSSWDYVAGVVASGGLIYVAGSASSPDFPGLGAVPPQCGSTLFYISKLDSSGGLLRTQPVDVPDIYAEIAVDAGGRILWAGDVGGIGRIDLSAPSRLTCVRDAADLSSATTVVPGELVSLFGNGMAPDLNSRVDPVSVSFDGIAAPVLYESVEQVNIQVPNEIAGKSQVTMTLSTQSDDSAGALTELEPSG